MNSAASYEQITKLRNVFTIENGTIFTNFNIDKLRGLIFNVNVVITDAYHEYNPAIKSKVTFRFVPKIIPFTLPTFKNCPYSFELKEGSYQRKQLVGRLDFSRGNTQAFPPDFQISKIEENGVNISNKQPYFSISEMGDIFVTGFIDLDVFKQLTYTLFLTLGEDECNVEIIITEVNDEKPVFSKQVYYQEFGCEHDLRKGMIVDRIQATDLDLSARLRYEIRQFSRIDYPIELSINNFGEIKVRKLAALSSKIWHEPVNYKYTIFAIDDHSQVAEKTMTNTTLVIKFMGLLSKILEYPDSITVDVNSVDRGSVVGNFRAPSMLSDVMYSVGPTHIFRMDRIFGDLVLKVRQNELEHLFKEGETVKNVYVRGSKNGIIVEKQVVVIFERKTLFSKVGLLAVCFLYDNLASTAFFGNRA